MLDNGYIKLLKPTPIILLVHKHLTIFTFICAFAWDHELFQSMIVDMERVKLSILLSLEYKFMIYTNCMYFKVHAIHDGFEDKVCHKHGQALKK